jgi:hypothetical protein
MRVLASDLTLSAETLKSRSVTTSARIETWRTPPPARPSNGDVVALSDAARSAADEAAEEAAADEERDPLAGEPRLQLLRTLIEAVTGRKVRLLDPRDLERPADSAEALAPAAPAAPQRAPQAPRRLGWGFEADVETVDARRERSEFSASGTVRTKDGRTLTVEAKLVLTRDRVDVRTVHIEGGDKRLKDPLVLDLGAVSSELPEGTFNFDLDADGTAERVQRIGGGSAFLVDDADGDGRATDGAELFGARSGDGFAELAALDGDRNGWIDEGDAAWQRLRVWTPDARGGALRTLTEAGVGALAVAQVASAFDLRDGRDTLQGQVRSTGVYLTEAGSLRTMRQLDLATEPATPSGDDV